MKTRRFLLAFLMLGFVFTMVACNNMDTIENRFEKAGYTIEEAEDINEYLDFQEGNDVLEIIDGFYILYNETKIVAYIYDFETRGDLEALLEEEGFTIEDFGDYIYKNVFLVTLIADDQDIVNAFQGQ